MRWFDGESIETEIVRMADRSRESQISRARSRLNPTDVSTALQMLGQSAETILFGKDDRTFEDFQQQVEKWHPRWLRDAPRHWLDRYLLAGHGVYALRLDNLTDQNFADVEVRLQIEGVAVEDEIPSEASALPEKPRPFGRGVGLADITRLSAAQMALSVGLKPRLNRQTSTPSNATMPARLCGKSDTCDRRQLPDQTRSASL